MADEKLYESAAVWDQKLQLGQRNLIQAICDHWPKGVRTALDVGCGDGKITHTLAERVNTSFHGFDGSREALSRLRLPSTHGDVSALPFNDDAFDLVLTTDVFEHLPDQVEQAAWQEIFRVARDWVFFAVPFKEELLDASTICVNCGQHYHVNWHQRSYDLAGLMNRAPTGWRLVRSVLSGERWSPMLPPETHYRRNALNEWSGWTEAVCPACGATGQPPAESSSLAPDVARTLGQYIYDVASQQRFARSHSEILVIFCRDDLPHENDAPPTCDTERVSAAQWVSRLGVSDSLDPYPQAARVVSAVDDGYIAQFPVYPASQPKLSITVSSRELVSIVVEDGNGHLLSGDFDLSPDRPTSICLPREICPGYYGLIVRMSTIKCIKSFVLEGGSPSINCLYPSSVSDCYFDVPGTTIRVHVTDHIWVDADGLFTANFGTGEAVASAVRALLRADCLCQQLSQEHQQLSQEHQQLSQEHQQLSQEHQQLSQEHQQLSQEHQQLSQEHQQLNQKFEVRIGDWMRRTLRAHRRSKGA